MRNIAIKVLKFVTYPLAYVLPLNRWNYFLGRIHNVKLHNRIKPHPELTTGGSANINIILNLMSRVENLDGDIAECGVFQGATIVSMGYFLKENNSKKKIFGFDSFEGFSDEEFETDAQKYTNDKMKEEAICFKDNNVKKVQAKINLAKAHEQIVLVKGYFSDSLSEFSSKKFSFVHLDCDLYEPYKECLEFFYPRMSKGGFILFDEYNDHTYEMCKDAVDDFLEGKLEGIEEIISDNQKRYFIKIQ